MRLYEPKLSRDGLSQSLGENKMNSFLMMEIATEVAWQLGDTLEDIMPRAESRWQSVIIAKDIIDRGLIDEDTTDIDEVINAYLESIKL